MSAKNFNSELFIIAQDWASEDYLNRLRNKSTSKILEVLKKGRDENLATNKNLDSILSKFDIRFSETYATNLFPFIKPEGMSSKIPWNDFKLAGKKFLLPQIDIIEPKLIVCLGQNVYNFFLELNGLKPSKFSKDILDLTYYRNIPIKAVYHTGSLGSKNAKGKSLSYWELALRFLK